MKIPRACAPAVLWFCLIPALTAQPAPQPGTQIPGSFKTQVTRDLTANYLLFLPAGYSNQGERWPMILFLHGAGERGDDLELVKRHGPPKIVQQRPDFPFIVVSPQCPVGQRWSAEVLLALLDAVVSQYRVDESRVYLTGLSMGGYGTWELAATAPQRFAAIAPICGGGTRIHSLALKDMPVWVFHGAKDPVVPLDESERMVAALRNRGNTRVQLTVYPEADHDSWTATYDNPDLYTWFLSHRTANR